MTTDSIGIGASTVAVLTILKLESILESIDAIRLRNESSDMRQDGLDEDNDDRLETRQCFPLRNSLG